MAGAGNYSKKNENNYRKLCKKACKKAEEILKNSGSAIDACEAALKSISFRSERLKFCKNDNLKM